VGVFIQPREDGREQIFKVIGECFVSGVGNDEQFAFGGGEAVEFVDIGGGGDFVLGTGDEERGGGGAGDDGNGIEFGGLDVEEFGEVIQACAYAGFGDPGYVFVADIEDGVGQVGIGGDGDHGAEAGFGLFPAQRDGGAVGFEEFGHGFGAGADLEFFVDAADVGVDGFVADAEFVGDFLVEEALARQSRTSCSRGERFSVGWGTLRLFGRIAQLCGRCAWSWASRPMDVPDGGEQFLRGGALEQVAGGAGGQGVEDVLGILVDGEHDDLGLGKNLFQATDAFHAVHAREVDVHEDDIYGLNVPQRHRQADERTTIRHGSQAEFAANFFHPLAHVVQAVPVLSGLFVDASQTTAVVFELQNEAVAQEPQSEPHGSGLSMAHDVGNGFLAREENVVPDFRWERGSRQLARDVQSVMQPGDAQVFLGVLADVSDQSVERVIGRIHRPDNLVQHTSRFAGSLRNLASMAFNFLRGVLVALHQLPEQRNLGEAGAELIVYVPRDAGALSLQSFTLPQLKQLALEFLSGQVMHQGSDAA
jgi:hypothetical protein